MAQEMVTISKAEYRRLKKKEEIDTKLLDMLVKSFEDIKAGRVKRWD